VVLYMVKVNVDLADEADSVLCNLVVNKEDSAFLVQPLQQARAVRWLRH